MHNEAISTTNATPAPVAALFDRAPLAAALAYLSGAIVERRNTIPILSCVLVEPDAGGARLTGNDLDIYASIVLAAAWDAPGSFAVDVVALLAAVKALTGDTVRIEHNGSGVIVSGEGVSSRVPALPADDFPHIAPIGGATSTATLAAETLAHDLARVSPAISFEETRYYLNGVFFHTLPGATDDAPRSFGLAATDGHRLAQVVRPMPQVEGEELPASIVPRKLVAALLKAMGKKPTGDVQMAFGAGKGRIYRVDVTVGAWSFRSKLIDGVFPDYQRVIPSANDKRAVVDAAALAKAARAVAGVKKENGAIRVVLSRNGMALSRTTPEGAHAAGGVAAAWDQSDPFVIGFNGKYLADAAALFAGDLTMTLADGGAPALLTSTDAPEFRMVVMPMRVGDETAAKPAAVTPYQPRETDVDVFRRTYRAAVEANDGAAMREAVATYRAAPGAPPVERMHTQVALTCANVRAAIARDADDDAAYDAARTTILRAAGRDRAIFYAVTPATARARFGQVGAGMRAQALAAAQLAAIDGYRADEPRDVVPVVTVDGKRRFVAQRDLQHNARVTLVKADGTYPRGSVKSIRRADIARVLQPRGAKASSETTVAPEATPVAVDMPAVAPAAAPVVDLTAIEAAMAALLDRVAGLEATVASQADALTARQVDAPVAAIGAPDDTRDAYISVLLDERDTLRDQLAAAEARAADFERIALAETARADGLESVAAVSAETQAMAVRMTHNLVDARHRTARRLVAARAAARTARRERIGEATARRIAETELARLAPLAAALAGLIQPAAAPVTPLRLVDAA